MAVNIRTFVLQAHSLDELVALGTLTAQAARFLEAAVAAGLNVLVSGGTQAGKTTLLNCLCASIPARERVVTCEEVFELLKTVWLHTCKRPCTCANPLTATARGWPSHASATTV
jgi:Flp pilus assembly CpaF family ATPase